MLFKYNRRLYWYGGDGSEIFYSEALYELCFLRQKGLYMVIRTRYRL